MLLAIVLTAVLSYLAGSINTSLIVSKFKKRDIRKEGSGNAGATNALRVLGKAAAAIVIIGDAAKAFVAVLISWVVAYYCNIPAPESLVLKYIAITFVVIGHDFPVFFGFKGGKGIVTSVACIFAVDWRMGIMVLGVGLLAIVLTRFVSLGSIIGCVLFPLFSYAIHMGESVSYEKMVIIPAIFLGALGVERHKSNIKKLMSGTENKVGEKKKN